MSKEKLLVRTGEAARILGISVWQLKTVFLPRRIVFAYGWQEDDKGVPRLVRWGKLSEAEVLKQRKLYRREELEEIAKVRDEV